MHMLAYKHHNMHASYIFPGQGKSDVVDVKLGITIQLFFNKFQNKEILNKINKFNQSFKSMKIIKILYCF
jgi:hypothetical protein